MARKRDAREDVKAPLAPQTPQDVEEAKEGAREDVKAPLAPQAPARGAQVHERWLALLERELASAHLDLREGPGGTGWAYNESKRAETVAWAEFLRAEVARARAL
jgi:hypothetical protein